MALKALRRLARRRGSAAMRVVVLLAALVPAGTWAGAPAGQSAPDADALGRAHATFPAPALVVDGLTTLHEIGAPPTEVPPSGAERAGRGEARASSLLALRAARVGPPVVRPVRPAGVLLPHFSTAPPLLA